MVAKLLDAFFGCWHGHLSFPRTVRPSARRGTAASLTGTYVVCLDCGKELPYDWEEMRVTDPASVERNAERKLATRHAA